MIDQPKQKAESELERLKKTCREAGLKLTHQRLEIYRELASTKEHPSAEAVHKKVQARMPTISLDTVYRTLATFADIGAVVRVEVSDDRAHFDADVSPHHHFICNRCRKIIDFNWETFDNLDLPREALDCGLVTATNVILRGLCRQCLKQRSALS